MYDNVETARANTEWILEIFIDHRRGAHELRAGDAPSIAMTMTFAVGALGIVGLGAVFRRDPGLSFAGPPIPFFLWMVIAPVLTWLAVELPLLQRWLDTASLTGSQWLAVVGLALLAPLLAIVEKAYRRSRTPTTPA
jgi:Ca2+-transporting ATPase